MGMNDLVRIGVFYDGYYFYKVSNYYKYAHQKKARISISGLHTFIRSQAAKIAGASVAQCQIIDAHYFKGRASARDLGDKVQAERIFDDILMRENIVTHYLPLRMGANNTLHEKGIDVWLALEAYEMSIYKKFDIIALIACDGDYVPLVRKLNTLGVHVMLISWDFDYYNENGQLEQTRTSQQLIEEVYHPVQMQQFIDENAHDELITGLFVQDREMREMYYTLGSAQGENSQLKRLPQPAALVAQPQRNAEAEAPDSSAEPEAAGVQAAASAETSAGSEDEGELRSTILNLKNGYGFISAPEVNNIFFFYDKVVNADFNLLEPGMPVRYSRVEDPEKTKIEGATRYHATRVYILWDEWDKNSYGQ